MESTIRTNALESTAGALNTTSVPGELRQAPTHMSDGELANVCDALCDRVGTTVVVTRQEEDGFPHHYPAQLYRDPVERNPVMRFTASLTLLGDYNCHVYKSKPGENDLVDLSNADNCKGITRILPAHVFMHEFIKAEKAALIDSMRQRDGSAAAAAASSGSASNAVEHALVSQLQAELSQVRAELLNANADLVRVRASITSSASAAEQALLDQLDKERHQRTEAMQRDNAEKQKLRDEISVLKMRNVELEREARLAQLNLSSNAAADNDEMSRLRGVNAELEQLVAALKQRLQRVQSSSSNNNNNSSGPYTYGSTGPTQPFTNKTSTFALFRNNFLNHEAVARIVDLASVRFEPERCDGESDAYRTFIFGAFRAWAASAECFAPLIAPSDWPGHSLVTTGSLLLRYLKVAATGNAKATLTSLEHMAGANAEVINDSDDDDFDTAVAAAASGAKRATTKSKKIEEKKKRSSPGGRTKSPSGNGGAGQESNKWRKQ